MIKCIQKDITTVERGIIGHGCNASGGFGSGVAGAIRQKWPKCRNEYLKFHSNYGWCLGDIQIIPVQEDLYVINMITQEKYGYDSKKYASTKAIEETFTKICKFSNFTSKYNLPYPIYIPKIGCGLGGLSFETDVRGILDSVLRNFPNIEVYVCDL